MLKFVEVNTSELKKHFKASYEEIMKVKIVEGDPINDFIDWVIYIFNIAQNEINYTGNMNLVKYAKGEYLEAIGDLVGIQRIEEKGAKATVTYTFGKIFDEVITIPQGHKIAAGNIYFTADKTLELPPGARTVVGEVTCTEKGTIGNNIAIGDLNTIVDDIPYLITVKNTTVTSGGVNEENDEKLRERIYLKPTAFSTAGPESAYKFYTLSAHQDISDVCVYSDTPGNVNVIPLLTGGNIPDSGIINLVKKVLDDEVRPFTDNVTVKTPQQVTYNINLEWYLSNEKEVKTTTENINKAIEKYVTWQCEKLGRDINPDKLVQLLITAGAKRVRIIEPQYTRLDKTKVAKINTKNINYRGIEDE